MINPSHIKNIAKEMGFLECVICEIPVFDGELPFLEKRPC
jgi:hypothetical protein